MDELSEFSVEEIKESQLVAWPRVAAICAMVSFSLPSFIAGLEIYESSSPSAALWSVFVGSAIVFIIGAIMGSFGALSRLSSYLLVRIAFGDLGAGIVNIAFAISLLGWFGISINLFAEATSALALELFAVNIPNLLLVIIASFLMTGTTFLGFTAINRLSLMMVPILVIVTLLFAWAGFSQHSFQDFLSLKKAATTSFGDGVSSIVGTVIIGAIILPDITRFLKNWRGAIYTAFVAYMVIQIVVMWSAMFAGSVSQQTDILGIMLGLGLGVGAFIIVIAGSWVLNSLNLYSAVLSGKATFPSLNATVLTLALGVVGVGAALLNILDRFEIFLWYLSVIFIPVAGVIIIDFFFIRRKDYHVRTLTKNSLLNIKAIIAWAFGAAIALLASDGYIPALSGIAAIDAVVASAGIYFILALLMRQRSAVA